MRHFPKEAESIFVPGCPFFSCDRLSRFVTSQLVNKDSTVNLALFLEKFPQWIKTTGVGGSFTGIALRQEFPLPSGKKERHDYKQEHLDLAVELSSRPLPNYAAVRDRHYRICGGQGSPFTLTAGRSMPVGRGSPSVLETAITLHRHYNIPVIPGSWLKGVARAYCRDYDLLTPDEDIRIFGNKSQSNGKTKGEVVFLDAWPDSWPREGASILPLVVKKVINPHYKDYYEGTAPYPSDDLKLVPISILKVAAGVTFLFAVIAPQGSAVVDKARGILKEALCRGSKQWFFRE